MENQTRTELWSPFCVAFASPFPKGKLPFAGTRKSGFAKGGLLERVFSDPKLMSN